MIAMGSCELTKSVAAKIYAAEEKNELMKTLTQFFRWPKTLRQKCETHFPHRE